MAEGLIFIQEIMIPHHEKLQRKRVLPGTFREVKDKEDVARQILLPLHEQNDRQR